PRRGGGDVDFASAHFNLVNGEFHLDDRSRDLTLDIPEINGSYTPRDLALAGDKLNGAVELGFTNASAGRQGRIVRGITSKADAVIDGDKAELSNLSISSSLGQIAVRGQILSFQPFKYDLRLKSGLSLQRISELTDSRADLAGAVTIEGAATGTNADYQANAIISSGSIAADGIRVEGFKVGADMTGDSTTYRGTAEVQAAGAQVPQADIGRTTAALSVTGKGRRPKVAGPLTLASIESGKVTVSNLQGRLDASSDHISISDLNASVLGGSVSGSASLALSGGESKVDVAFKSIDLGQSADLAPLKEVVISGAADGTATFSFPAFNYKAATGRLDMTFDAAVSRPQSDTKAPATGQVAVTLAAGELNVEKALIHSAESDFTATGTIDREGNASLVANFVSKDMAEVQRAIDGLGLIPDAVGDKYDIELAGPGSFSGLVQGTLSAPTLAGHVNISEIKSQEESVASLQGDVQFSQELLTVQNGVLLRPDGTRAEFALTAPLDGADDISATATLTGFNLHDLAKIASPGMEDFVGAGSISGSVHVGGLPGPRTIQGGGNVSVTAAEFNIPSLSEGKDEPSKMSVPEFAGEVTFQNSVLTVQNLQAQIGESRLKGTFSFNLDTYSYNADVEGKNIDLAQMAGALSDNAPLTGSADLSVKGHGDWDDWSTITLQAEIQGHNVSYAGREFGNAKLTANTEAGLLKVDTSGDLLGTPRTIEATVDLRDRKNYPISASVDFADTDIGPYLGLIAPQLSGVNGKATGSIKLGGPMQDLDEVSAVARLTKLEFGGAVTAGRRYVISNQGEVVLKATPKEVTLEPVTFTGEETSIKLGGTISREGGGKSNLGIDGSINLQLISSLSDVLYVSGVAEVKASVVGSLNAPSLTGSATLKDVGVQIVDLPFSVSHGTGEIRFTEYQAAIERFTATTPGGGDLNVTGGAALEGLVPDRWRVEVAADQVGVEYPRDTQTVFGGSLVFQGNRQFQVLSGDLRVRRAAYTKDVTLAELIANGGPFGSQFVETGPGGGGGPGPKINVDIKVDADNTLVIRDNLADATGSAHLQISGPLSEPHVSGKVAFTRGTVEFLNDRYELTRWLITFPGTRGTEPYIDLLADTDISGYRVTISLSGPFSKLRTTPSSDPPLSENDLVALILTGRPALDNTQALTNYAAGQTGLGLAQTLLSATLSEQLQRQTQRIFGLNRFSIDPLIAGRGADPTARVTVGQRINKDFTVTYSQNLTAGPEGLERIALVEYRLTNRFSIVGIRDETGSIGFNIRIRKRF
ncbi:MAG TPA: translocation/assembly module TamB domain-containing protein, partial [Blastocatellia bacterium]|nr:translocation/assembly module TamB domain-containing protein [Blastocatellia bacterium]